MKIELKVLIYSMLNNLIISVLKIVGGIAFNLGSLIADGMHTFSDFITDIVCLIGSKISKRKPTKYHPFGFGKIEYLTNLFIGILLLALGLYIIISAFFEEVTIPPISIIYLLVVTLILKIIAIIIMHKVGEKINSQLLIVSVEESKADLYSTAGVVLIVILLQFSAQYEFLRYSDLIGSILIGILVLKTALTIIIDNSLSVIGEIEKDEEEISKVKEILKEYKKIEDSKIELIKYGSYYKLQLTLDLDSKMTLRQVANLERKIKRTIIRHRSLKIKYITIYVTNKID